MSARILPGHTYDDHPKGPRGWIQWKGTEVCMDVHCLCGTHGHVDGEHMYYVNCKDCGRTYAVEAHVKLIPISEEDARSKAVNPTVFENDF